VLSLTIIINDGVADQTSRLIDLINKASPHLAGNKQSGFSIVAERTRGVQWSISLATITAFN
jgi:hypothetical protein